jgi:hypothetical protein
MTEELIKRLRGKYSCGPEGISEDRDFGDYTPRICTEAADKIEALQSKLSAVEEEIERLQDLMLKGFDLRPYSKKKNERFIMSNFNDEGLPYQKWESPEISAKGHTISEVMNKILDSLQSSNR